MPHYKTLPMRVGTLRFPRRLGLRVQEMMEQRDMKLERLLLDLIQIGVTELDRDQPELEGEGRSGEATMTELPWPKF